ncbi:hypothetical protein A2U01_0068492, partial [Trifolium medium]|nr:hypothetical protein [Trifolium medium]
LDDLTKIALGSPPQALALALLSLALTSLYFS